MTKTVLALAGLALASSASADLISGPQTNLLDAGQYSIHASPIDGPDFAGVFGTAYSNMANSAGYSAFAAATGAIGFDDYDSIGGVGTTIDVSTFRFVGGVLDEPRDAGEAEGADPRARADELVRRVGEGVEVAEVERLVELRLEPRAVLHEQPHQLGDRVAAVGIVVLELLAEALEVRRVDGWWMSNGHGFTYGRSASGP